MKVTRTYSDSVKAHIFSERIEVETWDLCAGDTCLVGEESVWLNRLNVITIVADHFRERVLLDFSKLLWSKDTRSAVVESISVPHPSKGDAKETVEGGSEERFWKSLFSDATDPEVERVERAVQLKETYESECVLELRSNAKNLFTKVSPDGVGRESVSTSSLNVQRS